MGPSPIFKHFLYFAIAYSGGMSNFIVFLYFDWEFFEMYLFFVICIAKGTDNEVTVWGYRFYLNPEHFLCLD